MDLAKIKTLHFWLAVLGNATGAALAFLVLTGSHHLYTMGALALAVIALNQAGISTAAAWLPPSVRSKLSDSDLTRYVSNAIGALQAPVTVAAPGTVETTTAVSETVKVTP